MLSEDVYVTMKPEAKAETETFSPETETRR